MIDILVIIAACYFPLLGSHDAILRVWWRDESHPTWHGEITAFSWILAVVVLISGDSWAGWGMWVAGQAGRSVGARLMEAMATMPGGRLWLESHVSCLTDVRRQGRICLALGIMYLADRGAVVGLAGLILSEIYSTWRRWRAARILWARAGNVESTEDVQ